MSNLRRKQEVARIRQEGYDARMAGKNRHACPYRNDMNAFQWWNGWEAADRELDAQENQP